MTDKEIIQALECCIKLTSDCDNCPYYGYDDDLQCFDMSKRDALNLINRQQAEIESIKKIVGELTYHLRNDMTSVTRYVKHKKENKPKHLKMQYFNQKHIEYQELAEKAVNNILKYLNENQKLRIVENPHNNICENIKAEAIKEFAEKVKANKGKLFNYIFSSNGFDEQIDNLVKEMVGDDK